MRSRKVEPGSAVMRTLIQSESTVVPPVTAERSPPDSRMTGADSPVIAASLTEATPSMISPSPGMSLAGLDQHDVADFADRAPRRVSITARRRLGIESAAWRCVSVRVRAQAVGLRLAAAFGDGLGEVGEQHREPEPGGDLAGEAARPVPA